jgi:hypothetical protein
VVVVGLVLVVPQGAGHSVRRLSRDLRRDVKVFIVSAIWLCPRISITTRAGTC